MHWDLEPAKPKSHDESVPSKGTSDPGFVRALLRRVATVANLVSPVFTSKPDESS